jgi:RNA polymerase sigma-70 factor (ECF subfamily)
LSGRDSARLTPEQASTLYLEYGERLVAFARGLLGDADLAREVVQVTFGRAIEAAGGVRPESLKAWLYRVAYNEAMAVGRRRGIEGRALERLSGGRLSDRRGGAGPPEEDLIRWEQVRRVREVLDQLPSEQRTVVQLRIYEERTFADIAQRLSLPLGTVLTRMRLALAKLHKALQERDRE